jgi:Proteasome maturation factor UMP1
MDLSPAPAPLVELAVLRGPIDHLRHGFRSLEQETNARHPVAAVQRTHGHDEAWMSKIESVRRTYGSHLAMRLTSERALLNSWHRLPGLESTRLGMETLMGKDTSIDFEDYLNGEVEMYIVRFAGFLTYSKNSIPSSCSSFSCFPDPLTRPEVPKIQLHEVMEAKLGIII